MNLRIKEICKEQGIMMKDLAERINITEVGLSKSLNGNPTIGRLQEISDALNVDFIELFTTQKKGVLGYIEYDGDVYKINSISDIEKLLEEIKGK
ncbi:helix-turn-helix domain-containing protein [Dysgonomonas macrotermitis]|uniref:Helix-turn-helix n=1 Tax=Dysgonomonas macrotermitis TaxID=1346286 RepID=A0A1M5C315_9BACT|nr:helix-turn-helix transcriptional regulator [Dysgonomonas macrotermitis]SHF49007.1 Helix-turn-helix [Dysgonomonas macrotermitis]